MFCRLQETREELKKHQQTKHDGVTALIVDGQVRCHFVSRQKHIMSIREGIFDWLMFYFVLLFHIMVFFVASLLYLSRL